MPKKRHNGLCKCKKTGAYASREQALEALVRVLDDYARKPLHFEGYVPTAVTRCRNKRGVWHLTSKDEKVRRGHRRGASWARNA